MFRRLSLLLAAALIAAQPPGEARAQGLTVAQARASMLGRWEGRIELLENGVASPLFNWPVTVSIEDAGDGRTYVERERRQVAGESRLSVRVTMLGLDGVTEYGSLYDRSTTPEHRMLTLSLEAGRDTAHWTLRGVENYVHQGRSLQARHVAIRDGDRLTTNFEVDPAGDDPPIHQIRWTLRRMGQ